MPPFTVTATLNVAESSACRIDTEPTSRTVSPGRVNAKFTVSVSAVGLSVTVTVSCTVTAGLLSVTFTVSVIDEGVPETAMLKVSVLFAFPASPLVTIPTTEAVKLELLPEPLKV